MSPSGFQNQILRRLSQDDLEALQPHMQLVQLALKQVLICPDVPIEHVYFVESGMCSVVALADGSEAIECGLIGREGMTDQIFEAGDSTPLKTIVQLDGSAYAVPAAAYMRWIQERPRVIRLVIRYQQFLMLQLAFTALSHGSFTIEERLARWLLMSFDRAGGDELPLVHDFISMMLGVRRSGVTNAIHVLEGKHGIRATRAKIHLRDREVLETLAAGSYGKPEAAYARLMGPPQVG
jgi:CRP-like cAMP-binding protein